jgi:hypothetical protein
MTLDGWGTGSQQSPLKSWYGRRTRHVGRRDRSGGAHLVFAGSGTRSLERPVQRRALSAVSQAMASDTAHRSETRLRPVRRGFTAELVRWLGLSRGVAVAGLPVGEEPYRSLGGEPPRVLIFPWFSGLGC